MAEKKYAQYLFSDFKEDSNLPAVAGPQAYFRGARQIPGAGHQNLVIGKGGK